MCSYTYYTYLAMPLHTPTYPCRTPHYTLVERRAKIHGRWPTNSPRVTRAVRKHVSPSHRRGTLKGVPTVKSPNSHF